MTQKNYIPADYNRLKIVSDLGAFLMEDFEPRANVIVCQRRLKGDYDALAQAMAAFFNLGEKEIFIKYKDRDKLLDFHAKAESDDLRKSLDTILIDMEFFQSTGARTTLRLLRGYSDASGTHDFHVDGMNQNFDRIFTCYNEPCTQFVRNDDVLKVEGHKAYVRDGAEVYQFHPGDIWKQRVRNKKTVGFVGIMNVLESKAKRAFVHRAQRSKSPRLMLVCDLSVDIQ